MSDGNVYYGKSLAINNAGASTTLPLGTISAQGNILGNVISANVYANLFTGVDIGVGGTITSNGQIRGANIISNGVVSSANISTGPIAATGAITTSSAIVAAGNVTGGNLLTVGRVSATGTISANYFVGNGSQLTGLTSQLSGLMVGNIIANGFAINGLTNLGLTNLVVTGNVTAGTFRNSNGTLATTGPAFIATIPSPGQGLPTSPLSITQFPLQFSTVSQNINNGYNSSTGIFIAPVAGFYQVSAACAPGAANVALINNYYSAALLGVYRNNVPVCSGTYNLLQSVTYGGVIYAAISASSVSSLIYLNVGDTLQCKLAYVTNAPTNFWNTYANQVPNYFQACWLRS